MPFANLNQQCTATSSRNKRRCLQPAIKGSTVCRTHGGASPQVKRKAEERLAVEKARQTAAAMVVAWEGEVTEDPFEGLLRMVRVSAMAEQAYAMLIQTELGADKCPACHEPCEIGAPKCTHCGWVLPRTGILTRVGSHAAGFKDEPHPYLKLWNDERDRYAKVCKLAIDAGIAERTIQVAEAQAAQFVGIIQNAITAAELEPAAAQRLRLEVANQMRLQAAA